MAYGLNQQMEDRVMTTNMDPNEATLALTQQGLTLERMTKINPSRLETLIGLYVRTEDWTVRPCGQPRRLDCPHIECQPRDAFFGAEGLVISVENRHGEWWLNLDWGYSIMVLETTTITLPITMEDK